MSTVIEIAIGITAAVGGLGIGTAVFILLVGWAIRYNDRADRRRR